MIGAALDFTPVTVDAASTGTAAFGVGLALLGLIVAISYGRKVLRAVGVKV